MTHNILKIIFIFLFLFLICFPLFSRDVTVKVKDADLDLPLEGAVIRTRDGKEFKCNNSGIAVINAPDDRQLVILIIYPGYETDTVIIQTSDISIDVSLRLSGIIQGRELVIEAQKPGSNETRTGRSVALTGREIAQSAEIGIIEDVMSAIKLLPGVGYSGSFNSQPSIRGGFPGDMNASLNGFYIFSPYHWGGGVSIFDPRMVQSAQLSHGVFSTRYGHTISGLLDITTKKPSHTETEFEFGASTSSANLSLSIPLKGKGGILFMTRTTYYDPVIGLAKLISKNASNEIYDSIKSIRVAPYIRSTTITGNYRLSGNLDLNATGFFGMDGVGVTFNNAPSANGELTSSSSTIFDFTNYQGFLNTNLYWNPDNNKLINLSLGAGFTEMKMKGNRENSVRQDTFSEEFLKKYFEKIEDITDNIKNPAPYETKMHIDQSELMFNLQSRIDFDWELFNGFIIAAGVQEMLSKQKINGDQMMTNTVSLNKEKKELFSSIYGDNFKENFWNDVLIPLPTPYWPRSSNMLLSTSGYILNEYHPGSRIKTELGLRLDHYHLIGDGFSLNSTPAINPRLSIDINILKNLGIIDSFDINLGTGLFSTMDNIVFMAEKFMGLKKIEPNRSWTSVVGTKFELPYELSINIEGYFKYIFNRMYIPVVFNPDYQEGVINLGINPYYDGQGRIWGIDVMLQKLQSRYWDGWVSYSYSYALYRDPNANISDMSFSGGGSGTDWYFPAFHRYHNLNLVLNFKPVPKINIYTRFGIASGVQRNRRKGEGPVSYPVIMNPSDPNDPKMVERYTWESETDETNRSPLTLPMDIKFSFFGGNKNGKTRYEVYFALENVLALAYKPERETSFNTFTGEVDTGSSRASYGIPIPIPSFGFKLSY